MKQSKKILAALVAVPASVVVADAALAAENEATITKTVEIKNDFIGSSAYTTQKSSKTFTLNSKADLEAQILAEMAGFTKGFTITYTGTDVAKYEETIKGTFNSIKDNLNKTIVVKPASADTVKVDIDTTELYGMFNNMRVKATETVTDGNITSVKLEFSLNYFGTADDLKRAKEDHTITASPSETIQKVKAVHDYVVKHTHYAAKNHNLGSVLSSGGSSHSYALWTYVLLKKLDPSLEVEYVYGIANGEYRSWNIVKIGAEWYALDVAANDSTVKNSQTINYRNFLTYTKNERRIISKSSTASEKETYNYFKTIDNLAQAEDALYYANAQANGEIFKLNLNDLSSEKLVDNINGATTGTGRMVYYKQTTGDTATLVGEYLYFINDSMGKYLYRYNLNGKEQPSLLVKEQIESITLTGSTLAYTIKGGDRDFLPLDKLVDLDNEIVQKVIKSINAITSDKASFKEDVKNARIMYMALTEEQKALVETEILNKLKDFENQLGVDTKSKDIIDKINALDELDPNFVKNVEAAQDAYNAHLDKAAIYNSSILKVAIEKITKAENLSSELNKRIEAIADKEDKNLFNQYEDFIPFIENLLKEYDSLLPSIRAMFTNTAEFNNYRVTAVELRQEAQNFINEVKIIDENSEKFFQDMDSLISRQNDLVLSQKELIRTEAAVVTEKINLYNTLKQEVAAFKEVMSVITADNVMTTKLTPELIAKMKAASQQFKKMKPSQQNELVAEKDLLDKMMERINNLTTNSKLTVLEKMLVTVTIDSMNTLDDITSAWTTADAAIVEIAKETILDNEDVLALLSAKAKENYKLLTSLKESVPGAKALQAQMKALSNTSTSEQISEARAKYDALESALKKFFTAEEQVLETQEKRVQDEANQVIVDQLIADIDKLSEDSPIADIIAVKNHYDGLNAELQALVKNSEKLLDLWKKVSADAEAYQKAIDAVNKAIAALTENSTREEIQKVIDAYNALKGDQKKQVINYEKIDELLSKLADKEQQELDQIAADKVKELILSLTDESSKADIEAARAAYEALSAEAKTLITKQVLDILKYYETRLTELSEQAKKEAAVVVDRINRITSSYTEAQIKNIRLAYNALSDLAKQYVTNLQKLIDAENNILYQNTVVKQAKIDANAFDVYMNDINRKSTTAEIAKARAYYNRLSAEAKKYVTTYEKLVRLETMWKDPEYLDLVFTYYPEYVDQVKPGGIVIEKPDYDPTYIPDDLSDSSSNSNVAIDRPTMTWTPYETMSYQNGRYTTKISSTQVQNVTDRNMRLKADSIEIVVPTADLKASTATVGVALSVSNNQLNIQFTEGNKQKYFSEYVEIHVPFSVLKGNASQMIERVSATNSAASFKVEGSSFIIRTKSSGTFKTASAFTYHDLPNNAQGTAIHELAKRGIVFHSNTRVSQSYKQVTKFDVASMIAKALDITSTKKSSYQDITDKENVMLAQGLLEAGIMSGATSARFHGEGTVTKQEAAIIIANMYRYLNQDLSKAYNTLTSSYSDVADLPFEARQSIAILELFGVVNGSGSFEPTKVLTRGEFAELLYKALAAIDYL